VICSVQLIFSTLPDIQISKASGVVVLLPILAQTKESARRYVIYCVAVGHMFLLCGARPYVSIMRR